MPKFILNRILKLGPKSTQNCKNRTHKENDIMKRRMLCNASLRKETQETQKESLPEETRHQPNNHITRLPDFANCSITKDFTQVPNQLLRNPNISGKAKAILCLLLSNKEGWHTYFATMKKMMKEQDEALRSGIKELEENGYLVRVKYRDKRTKHYAGLLWAYTDIPESLNLSGILADIEAMGMEINEAENPIYGKPLTRKPLDSETPRLGNPAPNNTNCKNTNPKNTNLKNTKRDISHQIQNQNPKIKPTIPENILAFSTNILQIQQNQFPSRYRRCTQSELCTMATEGAETLSKLSRLDKYDFSTEVKPAIEWALQDEFWCKQLQSPASLRKKSQSNGNTKFDNIFAGWSEKKGKGGRDKGTMTCQHYDGAKSDDKQYPTDAVFYGDGRSEILTKRGEFQNER